MIDLNLTVTLAAVFVTVGLLPWSIGTAAVARSSPTRRRLDALVAEGDQLFIPSDSPEAAARSPALVPRSPAKVTSLQRRLTTAGFHSSRASSYFSIIQLGLTVVL